ncbi:MAG TPA: hypothetical protein VFR93_10480 [Candidatus Limnocylindrales bacterium]|nr:hypothetical protein [Candidatus Limnocylindrales bacterium]
MDVVASDAPVGPDVEVPGLDELDEALRAFDKELPWPLVRSRLLPLLERVRPYPAGTPDPLRSLVPPGVMVSLGIDVGPAFIHVTRQILDRWDRSLADLVAQAIANVHARAAEIDPREVVAAQIAGVPVAALQTGLGVGSTLVLAPGELARIFGPEPRMFVAPMRDLIAGFPTDAEEIAMAFWEEIADQDPNHLHARAFHFDGSAVSVRPLEASRMVAGA